MYALLVWSTCRQSTFMARVGRGGPPEPLSRGDWVARTVTRTTLKGDATHFHFTATVEAYFNGERIFSDQDVFSIPRDFM